MSCLNFIILKVNGKDVSKLPHDEAVEIFLKAEEPISVEVRRRLPNDISNVKFFEDQSIQQSSNYYPEKLMASTACQTDISILVSLAANSEDFIGNEKNITDECLAPEIDIEEITLRKSRSDEKLGFTVSYSSGNGSASESCSENDDEDTCTDIYISDILPNSLAGRDGRLRQGDQILQINGRDISNKDKTESFFAESKNVVTLLVSRCLYTDDEFLDSAIYCDDKEHNLVRSQIQCDCQHNTVSSKSSITNLNNCKNNFQTAVSKIDTGVCFDLNHANIKEQLESVNKEISLLNSEISNIKLKQDTKTARQKITSPSIITSKSKKSNNILENLDKNCTNIETKNNFENEHIYETIPEDSEIDDSYYCSPYESKEQSRVEQWLKSQHTENDNTHVIKMLNTQKTIRESLVNRICKNNSSGEDYENSSSAYNTGGSCNSNPLTFEFKSDDKNESASTLVFRPYCRQSETINNCKECFRFCKDKLSPKNKKLANKITDVKYINNTLPEATISNVQNVKTNRQLLIQPANKVYTNIVSLEQKIKLQEKVYCNQDAIVPRKECNNTYIGPNLSQYQFVSSQQINVTAENKKNEQMVWKVKKRPDGTRYIVRRPIKSQLLQERSQKINEERNSITTEDETVSEAKVGRYWSKDDRKRHIEKAKERRQRQGQLASTKERQTQQWIL